MKFELVRRCQSALDRQVGETIRLKMLGKKGGVEILNQKTEYNRCLLPSLAVTGQGGNIVSNQHPRPETKKMKDDETRSNDAEALEEKEKNKREDRSEDEERKIKKIILEVDLGGSKDEETRGPITANMTRTMGPGLEKNEECTQGPITVNLTRMMGPGLEMNKKETASKEKPKTRREKKKPGEEKGQTKIPITWINKKKDIKMDDDKQKGKEDKENMARNDDDGGEIRRMDDEYDVLERDDEYIREIGDDDNPGEGPKYDK